jgi:LPXTG-motif cell wall-anchored protein
MGQLNWPIPVLTSAGLVMVLLGAIFFFRRREEEE